MPRVSPAMPKKAKIRPRTLTTSSPQGWSRYASGYDRATWMSSARAASNLGSAVIQTRPSGGREQREAVDVDSRATIRADDPNVDAVAAACTPRVPEGDPTPAVDARPEVHRADIDAVDVHPGLAAERPERRDPGDLAARERVAHGRPAGGRPVVAAVEVGRRGRRPPGPA